MSRPRESVLALFDPLLSSAEDESDREKENALPSSDTRLEFRTRLIDVGDATIVEEDEELTQPDSPRIPLRELPMDTRPMKRRTPPSSSPEKARTPPKRIAAPRESTFTQIINAIESTGLSFAEQPPRTLTIADILPRQPAASQSTLPEQPLPSALTQNVALPGTIDEAYTAEFLESFYNRIQVPDVSFNLIHDDVSFIAERWKVGGDGDSFELEEEKKPKSTIPPCPKFGFGTPLALAKQRKEAARSPSPETEEQSEAEVVLPSSSEPAPSVATPGKHEPIVEKPSSAPCSPKPAPSVTPMVTPVHRNVPVMAPPPVHALRIVKRIKRLQDRPAIVEQSHLSLATGSEKPAVTLKAPTKTVGKSAAPKLGVPITTGDGPKRVLMTDPSAPGNAQLQQRAARPPPRPNPLLARTTTAIPRPNFGTSTSASRLPASTTTGGKLKTSSTSGTSRGVVRRTGH